MKKIKLTANILFSGIGCQERGIEDSDLFDLKVLNTSEINKEAVVSYAAIHCGLTNEMVENYDKYPSREEMAQHLSDINLGFNPDKKDESKRKFDWFKLVKKKNKELEKYWLACKLTNNLGDISNIKELPYADFWTCSFPCQSISVAGKMKGLDPDSGTRSSLLWENVRLLKISKDNNTLPKYVMFENVKNLVSKKFIDSFNDLIDILNELGFNTYWKVINAKDCGIPQNRERVFAISIRKDIDNKKIDFPKPFDLGIRLKDILEDEVDEKYYLSEQASKKLKVFDKIKGSDIKVAASLNPDKNVQDRVRVLSTDGISQGLRATDYKDPVKIMIGIDKSNNDTKIVEYANCITSREDRGVLNRKSECTAVLEISENKEERLFNIYGENKGTGYAGNVWNKEKISPALTTMQGGNRQPMIIDDLYKNRPERVYDKNSPTLRVNCGNLKVCEENCKIRKLTPRECFKLMGLTFDDCDKAANLGISNTHLYKQAGNGIVTNCVELLAEHLYKAQYDETYVCTDENFQNPEME